MPSTATTTTTTSIDVLYFTVLIHQDRVARFLEATLAMYLSNVDNYPPSRIISNIIVDYHPHSLRVILDVHACMRAHVFDSPFSRVRSPSLSLKTISGITRRVNRFPPSSRRRHLHTDLVVTNTDVKRNPISRTLELVVTLASLSVSFVLLSCTSFRGAPSTRTNVCLYNAVERERKTKTAMSMRVSFLFPFHITDSISFSYKCASSDER